MFISLQWRQYRMKAVGIMTIFSIALFISPQMIPRIQKTIIVEEEKYHTKDSPPITSTPICKIPSLIDGEEFYGYFDNIEYKCSYLQWFGDSKVSKKAVCNDRHFIMTPEDCIVLSFGLDNDWSFDDAMAEYGCKVYEFDPTMEKQHHQRSKNVQFFNLGLGNIKGRRKIGMDDHFGYFEVDRYENILRRLNLTNKVIDYIKMDIELSELDFFQDIFRNSPHLLKNIRQLRVELHHGFLGEGIGKQMDKRLDMSPSSSFPIFWQYFHELKCHGFKLMDASDAGQRTEVVWVRTEHNH